jgi:hypothetical protein
LFRHETISSNRPEHQVSELGAQLHRRGVDRVGCDVDRRELALMKLQCSDGRTLTKKGAVEALVNAAQLTQLHFARNQASDNFQGDDEHEAWGALNRSLTDLDKFLHFTNPKRKR